jgi:hypothetical protein
MPLRVSRQEGCWGFSCSAELTVCVLLPCACRFAEYRKDDPASFLLHQNLSYFPQFMFNMRRSPFVQVCLCALSLARCACGSVFVTQRMLVQGICGILCLAERVYTYVGIMHGSLAACCRLLPAYVCIRIFDIS